METTTTTLGWAFYYMLKHPEIQQKVQEELDNIVGQREVTLKDRDSLPYTGKIVIQIPQSIFESTSGKVSRLLLEQIKGLCLVRICFAMLG